jgi:hypothetical protein
VPRTDGATDVGREPKRSDDSIRELLPRLEVALNPVDTEPGGEDPSQEAMLD